MKVVKFGGSSLADSKNILIAKSVVESDAERTFVVVSAPGKAKNASYINGNLRPDLKITDLLIDAHAKMCVDDNSDEKYESLETALRRFKNIANELGIDMYDEIESTRNEILKNKCDYDFVISRGEYLMSVLFSRLIGYDFLDAKDYIVIKKNGTVNLCETRKNFNKIDKTGHYVMGGFFGRGENFLIRTFARGGSDYTGAIVSVCLGADLYENFTDTYGVQTANPSIVKNTETVPEMDYGSLRTLCWGGATVIFPNCVPLLKRHAMPLKVDSTFDSDKKFTLVTGKKAEKPFFSITYETKANINKDMAEIVCVLHKIRFSISDLRTLLLGYKVYLVEYSDKVIRLMTPAVCVETIVNILHRRLVPFVTKNSY